MVCSGTSENWIACAEVMARPPRVDAAAMARMRDFNMINLRLELVDGPFIRAVLLK